MNCSSNGKSFPLHLSRVMVSLFILAASITLRAESVLAQTGLICPPVQVVFIVDTSGSMNDEASALCTSISQVEAGLASSGVSAQSFLWGITQDGTQAGADFACLTDSVANAVGQMVPGDGGLCGNTLDQSESWGEAIAVASAGFPWQSGAVRVVVPISDEGACNGGSGNCVSPSDDLDALNNGQALAIANNVFVSPIAGTGSSQCVKDQGIGVAAATGGEWFESTDPQLDLVQAVNDLILSACVASNNPPTASCQDVTVSSDENCMGQATVDNGSSDPEGGAVTVALSPAGPYSVGDTQVTLTVTDNGGLQSTCSATVTVLPTKEDGTGCNAPDPVNCTSADSTPTLFTLDGNARAQRKVANKLVRLAQRLGASNQEANDLRSLAQSAYLGTWTSVWLNPKEVISCEASVACSVSSLSGLKQQISDQLQEGFRVTQQAAQLVNANVQGKKMPRASKRILKRGRNLFRSAGKELASLPDQQTTCDSQQVNVVIG